MAATRPIPFVAAALLLAACGGPPPPSDPAPGAPEEERVEVGYGTQRRDRLTGAVASLDEAQMGRARVARVEELFEGRLAGVRVVRLAGGGYSVRVRGAGSLVGDGEPLFVIDGTPVHAIRPGAALEGLNPADVVRIDVLKDAASASIYGSRGANGVILITTRRPD